MEPECGNSKYERRDLENHPVLNDLSFIHMTKIFTPFWGNKNTNIEFEEDEENTDDMGENVVENKFKENIKIEEEFFPLYDSYNVTKEDLNIPDEKIYDEKFKYVLKHPLKEGEGEPLPKVFKIKNPFPGKPP